MQTAIDDLMTLLAIPGPSTEEAAVMAHIERILLSLGVPPSAILHDRAQDGSEYGGQCGNMVVRFPAVGSHLGPIRLFATHVDTVAIAKGCQPRLVPPQDETGQGGRIVNDASGTALGADNRTGCAALLQIARALTGPLASQSRPPFVLLFTVQEELGLIGARQLDTALLGLDRPVLGFNFDGCRVDELVTRVTGTERFVIEIQGLAAHAGADPAGGVSAAVIAGVAIADLQRNGWHGLIGRGDSHGTSNIGVIQGGENTNVVMDRLTIRCEARSHDAVFRKRIREAYEAAFGAAAAAVISREGRRGRVTFGPGPCYESFALPDDAPVVREALQAAQRCGLSLMPVSNDGGMDANWYNARGIPTVTFGVGAHQVHTVSEWIDVKEFCDACRIAVELLRM
jgi:tripeptide aminopeptidase